MTQLSLLSPETWDLIHTDPGVLRLIRACRDTRLLARLADRAQAKGAWKVMREADERRAKLGRWAGSGGKP